MYILFMSMTVQKYIKFYAEEVGEKIIHLAWKR